MAIVGTLIIAVLVSGALAIVGAERKLRWLEVVFKPLTTILLFGIVGWPQTTFARLVAAGIAFSVLGDVALLSSSKTAFLIGLGTFLLAHLAYVIAFIGVADVSWVVVPVAAVVAIATTSTVRAIWVGAADVRWPTPSSSA
jgi:uncharacterized membrane protein YhhN